MIYHPKSKKNKNVLKYVVILIFILILLFNVLRFNPFNGIVNRVSSPIIRVYSFITIPFKGMTLYFVSKKNQGQEIDNLKREIEGLRIEILEKEIIQAENIFLKESFGRKSAEDKGILGFVLRRPPFSPYDTFVIDLGKEKVFVGQTAYVSNVPIGEIMEVNEKTSIVRLFSSNGIKKIVQIGSVLGVEAIGKGGGRFVANVPRDTPISQGDIVISSGTKQELLGVIESIEDGDDTLKIVRFNLPVSLTSILFVEIR